MKKLLRSVVRLMFRLAMIFVVISLLLVIPFRWLNPPMSMVMLNRWATTQNEAFVIQQTWLRWGEIPKHAALAVMMSEDQLFAVHKGFDVASIANSLQSMGSGKPLRGASTISQQVARNMYLWTGRSWVRKGLEVWFTLLIELFWSKPRILEVYVNIAEWGEGVFGLEAASRYHYGKSAAEITPKQSALLAVSLPNPLVYTPARPSAYLLKRAQWNLDQQKWVTGAR